MSTSCVMAALLLMTATLAAQAPAPKTAAAGVISKPAARPFSPETVKRLTVPDGFHVSLFAENLGRPRMMAVGADGTVYVTRWETNDVIALRLGDGNRAGPPRVVASGLEQVHGIVLHQQQVFLASPTTVWRSTVEADGSFSTPRGIVQNLPDGGQHRGRSIAVGPDGMLYIAVGSSCNDCAEANKEHATMLRTSLDGGTRTTFARGLRDTIGFGWHPETKALWGMDNGADWKGDRVPPEELNRIEQDGDYGWPLCYGRRVPDHATVAEPKDLGQPTMSKEQYCAGTQPAMLEYAAHSAPIGMTFYTGTAFPAQYRHDAFVVFRGSWNRAAPTGYKVARVRFAKGVPAAFEDFLTGFLSTDGTAQFGRLAGIVVAPDGSLLVSDDSNGVIYRVAHGATTSR
ncbi:MAG: sorbosone dehydrogenase family protein [Acidobacteria bacterium]|nr:sorbosone dehydrogenase family protein [Acidobacteriota bacterium]